MRFSLKSLCSLSPVFDVYKSHISKTRKENFANPVFKNTFGVLEMKTNIIINNKNNILRKISWPPLPDLVSKKKAWLSKKREIHRGSLRMCLRKMTD